jgi:hypothetical protein
MLMRAGPWVVLPHLAPGKDLAQPLNVLLGLGEHFQAAHLKTELVSDGVQIIEYKNTSVNMSFTVVRWSGLRRHPTHI